MDNATNSRIIAAYCERTPRAARRHREALDRFPGGIVHDARHMRPYGITVERAQAARKWDVDGNEYVDYCGGHGALLLGHNHPKVIEAVQAQLARGMHFAAPNEPEVEWARLVQELIPSAGLVRFTSSGTEATHLAIRLARAATGRRKIVRFRAHFHGWHDHAAFGVANHFDGTPTPGMLSEVASSVVLVDPNDVDAVRTVLAADRDIALVMLEPTGASMGRIPTPPSVLASLREVTRDAGVLLMFDEVVTGFRVSPGGAQALYGVTPDITTLAKIIAGGMPGGAVAARRDILERIDFDAPANAGRERIAHQGTHNAHLISAAAGIATLGIIKSTDACQRANETAATLRARMNEVLEDEGVNWAVYGDHSMFHIFTNPSNRAIRPTRFDATSRQADLLKADTREDMLNKLRVAMLLHGVDLLGWRGGVMSAAHGDAEIDQTVAAWRASLRMMRDEGELPAGAIAAAPA
ncbi:MAG: aspartate aminotransferase family protein [Alphaproteobacteria bacterium]|nr:aspartate aminotransferase family protein [Alphaproteobacteria bacterium]